MSIDCGSSDDGLRPWTIPSVVEEGDLCWSFFLMYAQRSMSHSWLVAERLQRHRGATMNDGGGSSGCGMG